MLFKKYYNELQVLNLSFRFVKTLDFLRKSDIIYIGKNINDEIFMLQQTPVSGSSRGFLSPFLPGETYFPRQIAVKRTIHPTICKYSRQLYLP